MGDSVAAVESDAPVAVAVFSSVAETFDDLLDADDTSRVTWRDGPPKMPGESVSITCACDAIKQHKTL